MCEWKKKKKSNWKKQTIGRKKKEAAIGHG